MPYSLTWLAGKRVLLCTIKGDLSLTQIADLLTETRDWIQERNQPIYIIYDARLLANVPVDISRIRALSYNSTHRVTFSVIITSNLTHRFMGTILAKLVGNRLHVVPTTRSCVEILMSSDADLLEHQSHIDTALSM